VKGQGVGVRLWLVVVPVATRSGGRCRRVLHLSDGYLSRSDGCLAELKERTVDGLLDALEKEHT
jgi:hypothetical protein